MYRTVNVPADRLNAYIGADTDVNKGAGLTNTKQYVYIDNAVANQLNAQHASQPNGFSGPFREDLEAKISVAPNGGLYVPGSAAQINSGSAYGLVTVRNPLQTYRMGADSNREGNFIRVGGPKYVEVIASTLKNPGQISNQALERLIAAGFMYGLAPVFSQFGWTYSNGRVQGDVNAFDPKFVKAAYMKNPEQVRLGHYAGASAARNAASQGYLRDAANQKIDPSSVVGSFEQNQEYSGYHWAPEVKAGKQRRGLTSHPLRTMDGGALAGPVTDPNAGFCLVDGSGPGMGGNGQDEVQLRLQRAKRKHTSVKRSNLVGAVANGPSTYYCAPSNADHINLNRKIYQAGGKRGGRDGLAADLNAISQNLGRPSVSANAVQGRFDEWANQGIRTEVPPNLLRPDMPGFQRWATAMDKKAAKANPQAAAANREAQRRANLQFKLQQQQNMFAQTK